MLAGANIVLSCLDWTLLMTILFILAYCLFSSSAAFPTAPANLPTGIDFIPILSSRIDSDLPPVDAVGDCSRRSIWNIVWSCVTTIFACTWITIHPNVPGLRDTQWKILRRRLKLMLRVIILPETIVYWAWRQYYGAKEVADRYNNGRFQEHNNVVAMSITLHLVGAHMTEEPRWEERWTLTHGFFAIMGGFLLCRSDDKPIKTLTPNELFKHAAEGAIEWPKISEEEIWDRSKGDYLSKGFVVLQTSWFIITCLARVTQHLPITELEVVTLAFAALNGLIYFFWFHKPLDVRCPIHVYFKPSYHGPLLEITDDINGPEIYIPRIRHSLNIKMRLRNAIAAVLISCTPVWMAISRPFSDHGLILSLLSLAIAPADPDDPAEESSRRTTRVKTFHAPVSLDANTLATIYLAFLIILGLIFGGIHLAAWSFEFPTEVEKWIWRASSLTLVGSPVLFVASISIIILVADPLDESSLNMGMVLLFAVAIFAILLFCITMVGYLLARILLLVLPIISFRSLPPGALTDIKWTSLVPHVG